MTSTSFTIISYNVQAFLFKNNTKLKRILYHLLGEDYSIISLQELLAESSRDKYTTVLMKTYKTLIDRFDGHNFPNNMMQDSGLFIASKFPKVSLKQLGLSYSDKNSSLFLILKKQASLTLDFLANKSVTATRLELNSKKRLLLISTHTQAWGSRKHKLFQLKQIKLFIEKITISIIAKQIVLKSDLSIVLTGDFNMDSYDSDTNYSEMLKSLGNPRDLHKEFHRDTKQFSWTTKNPQRRYDYIFSYDSIESYQINKIKVNSISVFDVKTAGKNCSDHHPIKARLSY